MLPRGGARAEGAVGDPRVQARRRHPRPAGGVRAARGRVLRRGAGPMKRSARSLRSGSQRPGRRTLGVSREATVFAAATAILLVHALDDAFVHRGAGLGSRPARARGRAGRRAESGRHRSVRGAASRPARGARVRVRRASGSSTARCTPSSSATAATRPACSPSPPASCWSGSRRGSRGATRRGHVEGAACSPCPAACSPACFVLGPIAPRHRRDAQVARARRRSAERRLPVGRLRGHRRARPRRLVPAVRERRQRARRARRRQRPQGLGRPRRACSPATATAC